MSYFLIIPGLLLASFCRAQDTAVVVHEHDSLRLVYGSTMVFAGEIKTGGIPYVFRQQKHIVDHCTWQIVTIRAEDGKPFKLDGRVTGDDEAIACESDPAEGRIKLVRQVVGRSHSLLNNAVYERRGDWLFSVDNYNSRVNVVPANDHDFDIDVTGWEIVIRFRPRYYKEHRGLGYFDPSAFEVWKRPVVGWCSWFAYLDRVNETEIKETADVLSEKLAPYGLQYLQIDDGYEQQPIGMPDTWLHPNDKFPSGLKALASYIRGKGLTPGIWTNVTFADSAAADANRGLFVADEKGRPALGNWIGYVMDGSNPETIRQLVTPIYKGLNADGFGYFKLDALRHLKYEGYNAFSEYYRRNKVDRNAAYRNVVKEVRDQAGREKFLVACWGIRPELVGMVDGCRIGNDGFSYAGLAQFNSYNNIIWRNDPDHIVLSGKEAYRSCSATSLTGSLFMLTDQAEIYRTSPLVEAARRTIPVLFTQPGQVYDVDPSRSSGIAGADVEMSGSGPRRFDASGHTITGLFALEINRPFENWIVVGRLDDRDRVIPFRELGLDERKEYLVFEFWTKKFRGVMKSQLIPGGMDTVYHCQTFCIREKLDHPQLLATNRHISCGGLEISNLTWGDHTLRGVSELVASDQYVIYLYEGAGYTFDKVVLKGADLVGVEKTGAVRKLTLISRKGGMVEWGVKYKPSGSMRPLNGRNDSH
jgi:alpha-galactosidase